jgi:hypothetical protein
VPKTIIRIKEGKIIARIAAAILRTNKIAVVIGKTIYVYGIAIPDFVTDRKWLLHELKHIQQYHTQGITAFVLRYTYYTIKYGYYNNPYEKEARNAENDNSLLERYEW